MNETILHPFAKEMTMDMLQAANGNPLPVDTMYPALAEAVRVLEEEGVIERVAGGLVVKAEAKT